MQPRATGIRTTVLFLCMLGTLLMTTAVRAQEIKIEESALGDSLMNAAVWEVDTSQLGALMFLDVPYLHNDSESFVTLTVGKEPTMTRPSVISFMIPEPVEQEKGLYLSFASRIKRADGSYALEIDTTTQTHITYQDCNVQFCTARIKDAYASGRVGVKRADIFADFMKYDYLLLIYFDSTTHQNIRVPLASFKRQFRAIN